MTYTMLQLKSIIFYTFTNLLNLNKHQEKLIGPLNSSVLYKKKISIYSTI